MTKIETMENQARFISYSKLKITPVDWIEISYLENWGNNEFRYYYNGVEYDRQYIEEKIPFNGMGFEDEGVLL